jgi:hypothetical protein
MSLSSADLDDLRRARDLLENPGVAMKLTNLLGMPVEKAFEILPRGFAKLIHGSTRAVLRATLALGVGTMLSRRRKPSSEALHKLFATLSGATGGFFGIVALPIELPISTAIMLRSIADIARSEGEDLSSRETRDACIQVFALGGRSTSDDAAETGYFAVRAILARTVGEAAVWSQRQERPGRNTEHTREGGLTMGAMGPPTNRKWVLTISVPRPTAAETEKIWKILAGLEQRFGASVVSKGGRVSASKPPGKTKSKPRGKTKSKRK